MQMLRPKAKAMHRPKAKAMHNLKKSFGADLFSKVAHLGTHNLDVDV
jgi:hypothetical protein